MSDAENVRRTRLFSEKCHWAKNKWSRFKGTHQRASLATHSVWVTSKQLFGCSSHSHAKTPPSHPHALEHLPVWMAAAFSGALNGPQSAGEIKMLGARDWGRGGRTRGHCLLFGAFKWAFGEWRLRLGVGWMPLGLLLRLCDWKGGGCMGVSRRLGCTLVFIKAYKHYQLDSKSNYVKHTVCLGLGNALKSAQLACGGSEDTRGCN